MKTPQTATNLQYLRSTLQYWLWESLKPHVMNNDLNLQWVQQIASSRDKKSNNTSEAEQYELTCLAKANFSLNMVWGELLKLRPNSRFTQPQSGTDLGMKISPNTLKISQPMDLMKPRFGQSRFMLYTRCSLDSAGRHFFGGDRTVFLTFWHF